MDENDIFKKLNAGTKFSKKFKKTNEEVFSAEKVKKEQEKNKKTQKISFDSLDFFNTNVISHLGKRPTSDRDKLEKQEEINKEEEEEEEEINKEENSENEEENDEEEDEENENEEETEEAKKISTAKKINKLRKKYKIVVEPKDSANPISEFEELKEKYEVKNYLCENITKMGFSKPTPIQMQSIPILLEGNELLACAPTGSGKTASFCIPLLQKLKGPEKGGIRALIISPTRELAIQTSHHIEQLSESRNFRICLLTKSTSPSSGNNRRYDILISTPLRLVRLIEDGSIQLDKVEYLVLDEADQLFEYGFVKQVDEIIAACKNTKIQRCLFSATIPAGVEQMAKSFLRNPYRVIIGSKNAATDLVKQKLIYCGQEEGKILAIRQLIDQGIKPPVIIFVQSKERAMELFHELVYDGINVDVITADRTKAQRDNTVKNFRLGKIWVLIATDLMARGMDFKGVNMVINFDIPPSAVQYIHRIGRAGRAGRSGESVTLYTLDDIEVLRGIVNVMKASGMKVPEWMNSLPKALPSRNKMVVERDSLRTDAKTLRQNFLRAKQKRLDKLNAKKQKRN